MRDPRRTATRALVIAAFAVVCVAPSALSRSPDGAAREEAAKLWVFFTDKALERGEEREAIEAFESELPERALRRRAKVGFEANTNDLPVAREYADAIQALGAEIVTRSRWLNAVSVLASSDQASAIATLPFVREVRPVARGVKELPEVVPSTGGAQAAPRGSRLDYGESFGQLNQIQVPDLHDDGFDGQGVLIAMLDTGFDTDHQAYRHLNIVAERDFINDDLETADEPGDPSGQDGHGTATLSCVGAKYAGELYGGSFHADFMLCKTEMVDDEIQVEEDYWVEAIEWADSLGADVASSSLGYFYWYTYEDMDGGTAVTTIAADMAAARGIVVVNSMGNEGDNSWTYMIAPADGDSVLSVGAVNIDGDRVGFSSVGPTYDGRIKPDVMALGSWAYVATSSDTSSYGYSSGTSFSCPITAGAVGLLIQGHPDWTPQQVFDALHSTATQSTSPDTLMGWGIAQAYDAMYSEPLGVEGGEVVEPRLVWATPVPSSRTSTIHYVVPRRSHVRVAVYDPSGRLVKMLASSELDPGSYSIEWDGLDQLGERVSSGVYFVRLVAAGESSATKIVLVR